MSRCSSVALFARAWIEIRAHKAYRQLWLVALFARAWIEILHLTPSLLAIIVALFARAWIEIASQNYKDHVPLGRPLCEGVD